MVGERQCHTFQFMISLHLRKTSPYKTVLIFRFLCARSCGLYTVHSTQKYNITNTVSIFKNVCVWKQLFQLSYLYEREIWSLYLREENRATVFGKLVLLRI
jgi:hypothetical protein